MKRNKIALILTIVFFSFMTTYSAWNDLRSDKLRLENASLAENRLQQIIEINRVIAELQKERGLTAIYHANPNDRSATALEDQRRKTNKTLDNVSKIFDISDLRMKHAQIWQNTDTNHTEPSQTFKQYTLLITELMSKSETLVFNTTNTKSKNSLTIYHLLKNVQENTGQLRAKVGIYLASGTLTDQNYQDIIALHSIYLYLVAKAQEHQLPDMQTSLDGMQEEPCAHQTFGVIQDIINRSFHDITMTPLDWFELSTCAVDHIHDAANHNAELILANAVQSKEAAKESIIKHIFFWMGVVLTLIVLLLIAFKRSKELVRKHSLLENYQEAIDYSTIVSKADKDGRITYVNSAFCDISGYELNELLHKPHNIVRHPDMPKEVFQVMWDILKEGKKWKGIVKNLKKDGTSYWVDASISPIFDDRGELIEYIAIRRDVTDIILLNEEIRNTQSELIYRMGEAVESRSKESGHHVQRVAHYSKLLAQIAGLELEECEIIFAASTMHDVGKLSIPDAILLKEGGLTDEEWTVMKTHAEVGYKILEGSERPLLKMAATVAYEHHEHFDGNGYPRGLKADEISIYGRIVAIADVLDALATDRIYKKSWPIEKILIHLKEQSGKQFDPELIALVLNHLDQFLEIKNKFQDQ